MIINDGTKEAEATQPPQRREEGQKEGILSNIYN